MLGFGTIINSAGIIAGGLMGHFTGKLFKSEQQEALNKACGISVCYIYSDCRGYGRNAEN